MERLLPFHLDTSTPGFVPFGGTYTVSLHVVSQAFGLRLNCNTDLLVLQLASSRLQ